MRRYQRSKISRFSNGMKITIRCLFIFGLSASAPLYAENILYNPDFEEIVAYENLWDGVGTDGNLRVFNTTGGWAYPWYPYPDKAGACPRVIDIDTDGLKDIVCGDGLGWLYIYRNVGEKGAPKFSTGTPILNSYDLSCKPWVVDWDDDGKLDILVGTRSGNVWFIKNTGTSRSPNFVISPGIPNISPKAKDKEGHRIIKYGIINEGKEPLDIGTWSAPCAYDINGDYKKDLLLGEGTYSANSVYCYLNSGSLAHPTFIEGSRQYLAYGEERKHLVPSVWKRDRIIELVVGSESGLVHHYAYPQGKGPKTGSVFQENIPVMEYRGPLKDVNGNDIKKGKYSSPFMVDWDDDGRDDLVFGDLSGYIYLCRNVSEGEELRFAPPEHIKGRPIFKDEVIPVFHPSYKKKLNAHTGKRFSGRCYLITADDEESYSGKYCLKIECLKNYPGPFTLHFKFAKDMKVETRYNLTFFSKGRGINGKWKFWYACTDKKIVTENGKKRRIRCGGGEVGGEFRSHGGDKWQKLSRIVVLPQTKKPARPVKKISAGVLHAWFTFDGNGVLYIDKMSLTEVK